MNIKTANELLANRTPKGADESVSMVIDSDLWLKGKGLAIKKSTDVQILAEMEEGFNSENVLPLVVGNRVDGLLGREPGWSLLRKDGKELTPAEIILIKELSSVITDFWNQRELLDLMREMYLRGLLLQRDEIRPFVPNAYKDANGVILRGKSKTPEEILKTLFFERVSSESAGVFANTATGKPFSVYRHTRDGETFVDFSFVDADDVTKFRTFSAVEFDGFLEKVFPTIAKYQVTPSDEKTTGEDSLDLGGKLAIFEMDLKQVFVTDTMRRNQKAIALPKTMKGRNDYTAGVRERHWLNSERPKEEVWIDDPDNAGQRKKVLREVSVKIGAGVSTFTQGSEIYDQNNKLIGHANASLVVIDPIDPKFLIDSKNDNVYSILSEASQTHILATDSVAISGVSRKDSRSEHQKKLKKDKPRLDALGRYIIEFSLAFIGAVSDRAAELSVYRCDFNTIVDAGMPTPDETAENRKSYEIGEISLEELMLRNGVEDPQAMLSAIKSEDGYEFNLIAKAAKAYADAGGAVPLNVFINVLPIDEAKKKSILDSIQTAPPDKTKTAPGNNLPMGK